MGVPGSGCWIGQRRSQSLLAQAGPVVREQTQAAPFGQLGIDPLLPVGIERCEHLT